MASPSPALHRLDGIACLHDTLRLRNRSSTGSPSSPPGLKRCVSADTCTGADSKNAAAAQATAGKQANPDKAAVQHHAAAAAIGRPSSGAGADGLAGGQAEDPTGNTEGGAIGAGGDSDDETTKQASATKTFRGKLNALRPQARVLCKSCSGPNRGGQCRGGRSQAVRPRLRWCQDSDSHATMPSSDTRSSVVTTLHCSKRRYDSAVLRCVQVIDDSQLDVGIVHNGNLARVRSFMHKLRSGVKVKMGARRRLQMRHLGGHGLNAQGLCSSVLAAASCLLGTFRSRAQA